MSKRYYVFSDAHLEFRLGQEEAYWDSFPKHSIDYPRTAIIAGDLTSFGLSTPTVYRHFTSLCKRFDKVIYVPGNHEYYGNSPETVSNRLAVLEKDLEPSLKVLRAGEPYIFDGQRFIGDTMWFPDRPEVHIYRRMVNDSIQIKGLFPWCFTQSNLLMSALEDVKADDIVVTHHVPNNVDTKRHWLNSPTQAYFVNKDCELWWTQPKPVRPKAWIYGHTHDKHNYTLEGCSFICNPVGYPGENGRLPEAVGQYVYEL